MSLTPAPQRKRRPKRARTPLPSVEADPPWPQASTSAANCPAAAAAPRSSAAAVPPRPPAAAVPPWPAWQRASTPASTPAAAVPPWPPWQGASTSDAATPTLAKAAASAAPLARPTAAAPRASRRSPPPVLPPSTAAQAPCKAPALAAAPTAPRPLPSAPRFPAPLPPLPAFAVARFPSPPRGRGVQSVLTSTLPLPQHMPTLSPDSPMETAPASTTSPSFAAVARTTAATTTTSTATATSASTTAATAATAAPSRPPRPDASRYPPLVVEVLPDWPTHFRELKKLLGHTPNGRPFQKGVRFLPKSDQELRVIQRYLTQLESTAGVSWFCYSLPAERSVKVAIRGLPANTEPAHVEQELRELGYVPEYVRSIPARTGRPGCLMFAQLQRTPNLSPGIYETRELLCMPGVTIEAWRGRKGAAQCHRCQQFRHSSHHCHRPIVCVRCGEGHTARDCTRPREEPATCANCGGAHTANNASCPALRKEARNRRAGTVARTGAAAARPATTTVDTTEPNAPGSLMAAANQPHQQPTAKRRRKRGKRARKAPRSAQRAAAQRSAPESAGEPASQSAPAVVAASERRTKAKRTAAPQPAPQPTRGPVDPKITAVVGALNRILTAIQEQRDPVPLILGCIAELCHTYG